MTRVARSAVRARRLADLGRWCPGAELNHRHTDFQSVALPTELPGHAIDNTLNSSSVKIRLRGRFSSIAAILPAPRGRSALEDSKRYQSAAEAGIVAHNGGDIRPYLSRATVILMACVRRNCQVVIADFRAVEDPIASRVKLCLVGFVPRPL